MELTVLVRKVCRNVIVIIHLVEVVASKRIHIRGWPVLVGR